MDRLIYTAMTGAKHVFMQQAGTANNPANASTIGFGEEHRFRAVPVIGEGMPTRAFTVDASVSDVMDEGPLMFTGRNLDVGGQGAGWIAVQLPDGSEAYTAPAAWMSMSPACCRPRAAIPCSATAARSPFRRTTTSDRAGWHGVGGAQLRYAEQRQWSAGSSWSIRRKPIWCAATTACSRQRRPAGRCRRRTSSWRPDARGSNVNVAGFDGQP